MRLDDVGRWDRSNSMEDANTLRGEVRRIGTLVAGRGIQILSTQAGVVIQTGGTTSRFKAKINSASALGNNRWSYSYTEVVPTGTGYSTTWTAPDGGRSGTAYNGMEVPNNGSGLEGNGVNVDGDDFPAGFAIQPITAGVIVDMEEMWNGSTWVYWFSTPNGVDGTC